MRDYKAKWKIMQWRDSLKDKKEPPQNGPTQEDITKAFNEHKGILLASENELCCGRGTQLHVANTGVLLRRMLETLGFEVTK